MDEEKEYKIIMGQEIDLLKKYPKAQRNLEIGANSKTAEERKNCKTIWQRILMKENTAMEVTNITQNIGLRLF